MDSKGEHISLAPENLDVTEPFGSRPWIGGPVDQHSLGRTAYTKERCRPEYPFDDLLQEGGARFVETVNVDCDDRAADERDTVVRVFGEEMLQFGWCQRTGA